MAEFTLLVIVILHTVLLTQTYWSAIIMSTRPSPPLLSCDYPPTLRDLRPGQRVFVFYRDSSEPVGDWHEAEVRTERVMFFTIP